MRTMWKDRKVGKKYKDIQMAECFTLEENLNEVFMMVDAYYPDTKNIMAVSLLDGSTIKLDDDEIVFPVSTELIVNPN